MSFHLCLRAFLLAMFCAFLGSGVLAQNSTMEISGSVIDGQSKKPLAGATIYLDRTTRATSSADGGGFVLRNIPSGNYQVIVSYVGYKSVSINVTEQFGHQVKAELYPDEKILNEVIIGADTHWEEYYSLFKMFFLGKGALQCIIKNPHTLKLHYDNTTYILTASTREPLIIENQALGYRVYYDLISFTHHPGRTSYSGHTHFDEMQPASDEEKKKWESNREKAYYGSFMHFVRSLLNVRLMEEGFVVRKLVKAQGLPGNHPVLESWQGGEFKSTDTIVSLRWSGIDYDPKDTTALSNSSKKWGSKSGYNVLYPQDLTYDSILPETNIAGKYKLSFSNSLFVTYKNKKITDWGYGNGARSGFPTSILTMLQPETPVDSHGNLADPNAVIQEGYWAILRVADQLPDDYEPGKEKH
ncbi:carboxypeptidase-like regulatory domain-containing protein [Mucilaginibacter sp. UR6-11]|uniref:carboxypeptidase-like regulatory domain-containing protein n=1 Tax=Mucilaginibacter sp. UR6-11 TaxID=1435644 RepID=UPI001E59BBAB|nr:carboxypeptidase-like regulatory domain-containing protein [Mucilaginibacter sp. UR6-11]MCC8426749.1 carboxypeptidase-like regulatory domain-containing protein [Mucilaginibacter sp. UR6-11]